MKMPNLLKRFGILNLTILYTLFSITLSVLVSYLISAAIGAEFTRKGIIIAVIVPSIVTPIFAYSQFRLVLNLKNAEDRLRQQTITDELTQVYNRRFFFQLIEKTQQQTDNFGASTSILILDLDNFKLLNDQFGHLTGDKALQTVARTCEKVIRVTDKIARFGGDEFVIFFPNASQHQVGQIAKRLHNALNEVHIPGTPPDFHLAVSIGTATFPTKSITLEALIGRADQALYQAKHQGGNLVVVGSPVPSQN